MLFILKILGIILILTISVTIVLFILTFIADRIVGVRYRHEFLLKNKEMYIDNKYFQSLIDEYGESALIQQLSLSYELNIAKDVNLINIIKATVMLEKDTFFKGQHIDYIHKKNSEIAHLLKVDEEFFKEFLDNEYKISIPKALEKIEYYDTEYLEIYKKYLKIHNIKTTAKEFSITLLPDLKKDTLDKAIKGSIVSTYIIDNSIKNGKTINYIIESSESVELEKLTPEVMTQITKEGIDKYGKMSTKSNDVKLSIFDRTYIKMDEIIHRVLDSIKKED